MNTRPKRKKVEDAAIELSSDSECGNETDSKRVKKELLAANEPGMKRKEPDQHDVVIDTSPRAVASDLAKTRRRGSTYKKTDINLVESTDNSISPIETPLEKEVNAMSVTARDLYSEKTFATKRSEIKSSPVTRIDRSKEKTKERTTRLNSQIGQLGDQTKFENLIVEKFGAEFKENNWQIARSEIQSDRFDEGLLEADEIVCDRKVLRGPERGSKEFRIKWRKYPDEEPTWESEANLVFCRSLISEYEVTKRRLEDESIANWRKSGKEKLEANNGVVQYSGNRKNETGNNELKKCATGLESAAETEACICRCEKSIFKPENYVDKSGIDGCRCEEAEKSTKNAIERLEKQIEIQNEKNNKFTTAALKPLEAKALTLLEKAHVQKTNLVENMDEINRIENEIAEKKRLIFEKIGANKLEIDVVERGAESFLERRNELMEFFDDLVKTSVSENGGKTEQFSKTKSETNSSKYLDMKNDLLIFEQKLEQTAVEKFLLEGAIKSKTHAADFKKLHKKESLLRDSCQELREKIHEGKQKLADTDDSKIRKDKTRKILNENIKKIDEAKCKKIENKDFDKENTMSETRKIYKTEKLTDTTQSDEEMNFKLLYGLYDMKKSRHNIAYGELNSKKWEIEWVKLTGKFKEVNAKGGYWDNWRVLNPNEKSSNESKKGGKYWKEKWECFEAEQKRFVARMKKDMDDYDMMVLVPDYTLENNETENMTDEPSS